MRIPEQQETVAEKTGQPMSLSEMHMLIQANLTLPTDGLGTTTMKVTAPEQLDDADSHGGRLR